MVAKRNVNILWVAWLILWPFILWFSYAYYFVNIEGQLIDILLFAIFMCIVALFPLTINNNSIFFVNGISIAVFLTFGLFVEIILTQIAVLIVLVNIGLSKKELFRFPLNMLMIAVSSMIGAGVYRLLGGDHGIINYQNTQEIIAIFGYALTVLLANQLVNNIVAKYFYQRKPKLIDKGFIWELTSSLIVIPVGFVLFVLYLEIGWTAIFFMGIPFVFISVILKLLYSYQEINHYLERTGEIGHQLTKRLELNEVYDVFIKQVGSLLPMDKAYVYHVVDNAYLELERSVNGQNNAEYTYEQKKRNDAFSGMVLATGKPVMYKRSKDWSMLQRSTIPLDTESVLSVPVEYGENIIGVVTIISNKKKAYEKFHFRILDILSNYLGVAVENAKNYEETKIKSEKDGLTGLYNYRYFEDMLENYFKGLDKAEKEESISLLLIDLDHFKMTNDTYGHEAGNEILYQVANQLKEEVGDTGVVARYGGEEFVVFLPDFDLGHATQFGESIRANIANNAFPITKHLYEHDKEMNVHITASIGVATYPVHCDNPSELIRHADRAMYIGAKQKGRNKVAVYRELTEVSNSENG